MILCRPWTRHAAAPFFDDLQKRASHPAWGSRSGCHVAIAVLLRCESLVPTCTNVLPTQRGDYILDPDVPYVIRCEMKYHWKDFSRCRGSMKMCCPDGIGRENWEWAVTTFGKLSRLMLPPCTGEETLTEVCRLTG